MQLAMTHITFLSTDAHSANAEQQSCYGENYSIKDFFMFINASIK